MSKSSAAQPARLLRKTLRREIIAILTFKLLALIGLRFVFFDDRPEVTPARVEDHLLKHAVPLTETDRDRR